VLEELFPWGSVVDEGIEIVENATGEFWWLFEWNIAEACRQK
jgi:hypothetical protein